MSCTGRYERKLTALALRDVSSEDESIPEHVRSCPSCQRVRAQLESLRQAASELRAVPPAAGLRDAVMARISSAAATARPRRANEHRNPGLRRTLAVVAVGVLAVVGLAVSGVLPLGSAQVGFQLDGRSWHIQSSYGGQVTLADAHGGDLGHKLGPNWPVVGPEQVSVEVDGLSQTFSQPGRHEVKDAAGQLLGYVVLRDVPAPSPLEALRLAHRPIEESGGASGIEADHKQGLVRGFDCSLDLVFEVRGPATVTYTPLRGGGKMVARWKASEPTSQPPSVEWTIKGQTVRRTGYGSYEIKGADGSAMATLAVAQK